MRRLFLFVFFLFPFLLQAQDVTGIWQGHFRSAGSSATRNSIFDDRYRFEVQIAQNGKAFEGVTYSYLSTFFYGKATAGGTVNVRTSKVLLQEGKLIEWRNNGMGDVCIMTCFLQYTKSGEEEFLEGTYTSMNVRDSSNCGRGSVFLHKVPTSDFYTEPFVAKREKEIADADSLKSSEKTAVRKPEAKPVKPGVPGSPTHRPATGTAKTPPATAKNIPPVKHPPATTKSTPPAKNPPAIAKANPPVTKPRANIKNTPPEKTPPAMAPIARATVPHEAVTADSNGTGLMKKFPTIAPPALTERENRVVKTLVVHTNEVTLNIYDDGAIDHDTVSVYVDNKQVINHAMLTDRPLVVTIHLDDTNNYHEVVMVAENEGEIPPNTSLMIVKAGDKEYEVRITSTEQKNAVVKFQYVK
jgi:hypothetical protein